MEKILGAAVALVTFAVVLKIVLDDVWRDPRVCPYCAAPLTTNSAVCPRCRRVLGKRQRSDG